MANRWIRAVALAALAAEAASVSACTPTFVQTGPTLPSRGDWCEFEVLPETPRVRYTELGILKFPEARLFEDPAAFKREVATDVCMAGGDGAIPISDGDDVYKGAVIVSRSAATSAPPPFAEEAGCQYDVQCKGDRICSAGACRAPSMAARKE